MKNSRTARVAAAASLALVAALTLSSCSSIVDAAQGVTEKEFDDFASAEDGWPGEIPAWLPADVSEIHVRSTNNGKVAMVRADTTSKPAGDCAETERKQIAVWVTDWSPEKVTPETVIACGDWEIMPVDGGWFGWYSADE